MNHKLGFKMSQRILKKNLALLQKINTKLAYQIAYIDPSAIAFCHTEQDELNLERVYEGDIYYYHSQEGALDEAIHWFKNLKLEQAQVLFIYGIGLGYYYEAAKEWLKQDSKRTLVFLEKDLAVLHRLLETKKGTELLKDSQVQIVYFADILTDKTLFNELSWTYIQCPFAFSHLKLYEKADHIGLNDLQHAITHDAAEKRALVDEYMQYGVPFLRNFYPNLYELPKAYWGNGLFGQFKNVPAIICGAGPSLNKNFDTLKTLADRALIFAGSSSLSALIPKGVIPHFGVAIDPNSAQFRRVASVQGYGVPFFYRNRLFHEALLAIQGQRLYLAGTGGYEIGEWFEKKLGLEGEILDEGHNVVNFSLEIAQALGCNPIILVGVDLAFTKDHYADGVTEHLQLTEQDFKKDSDFDSLPLIRRDIYNHPVYTLWKWITESEWIAEFAKSHPDIQIINATEGGLGFTDVPNEDLAEVLKKLPTETSDFYKLVEEKIKPLDLASITKQKIIELMHTFQESLERSILHLDTLRQEIDNLLSSLKQGQEIPDSLETAQTLLTEIEIEEEAAYQFLLDTFNLIYTRLHHRTIQNLQFPKRKLSSKTIKKRKLELQLRRLKFLKDVARVNIELIKLSLRNQNESL